jgi:hypothetical protein
MLAAGGVIAALRISKCFETKQPMCVPTLDAEMQESDLNAINSKAGQTFVLTDLQ